MNNALKCQTSLSKIDPKTAIGDNEAIKTREVIRISRKYVKISFILHVRAYA